MIQMARNRVSHRGPARRPKNGLRGREDLLFGDGAETTETRRRSRAPLCFETEAPHVEKGHPVAYQVASGPFCDNLPGCVFQL